MAKQGGVRRLKTTKPKRKSRTSTKSTKSVKVNDDMDDITSLMSRLFSSRTSTKSTESVKVNDDMDDITSLMSQLFSSKTTTKKKRATRKKSNVQKDGDVIMKSIRNKKKKPKYSMMATRRSTRTRVASSRTQHGIAQSWGSVRQKIFDDYTNRIRPENPTLDEIKTILAGEGITINIGDNQLMKEYIVPLNIAITKRWIANNPTNTFKSFADDMLNALEELGF